MNKEVFIMNQYSSIKIDIKKYMDARDITQNALAKAINTRFEVIDKWYNGLNKNREELTRKPIPLCFLYNPN